MFRRVKECSIKKFRCIFRWVSMIISNTVHSYRFHLFEWAFLLTLLTTKRLSSHYSYSYKLSLYTTLIQKNYSNSKIRSSFRLAWRIRWRYIYFLLYITLYTVFSRTGDINPLYRVIVCLLSRIFSLGGHSKWTHHYF